ncbi:hypothetical protein GA0070612_3309 [Micromonospora chokoriensis]|uniref:Uncharacterized protein n=1 Tax=Micromonospora chokoriensis TaxID=356851 RepID=A0A1C4X8U5_9ACTN|nr:hypothetical protein GA0070612_3309 [Micromonospora chokoriensis]
MGALRPGPARYRLRTRRGSRGTGQPARGPPQLHPGGHRRARGARGAPPGGTRRPRLPRPTRVDPERAAQCTARTRSGAGQRSARFRRPVGAVGADAVPGDPRRDAPLRRRPGGHHLTLGTAATAGDPPGNPARGTRTRRTQRRHGPGSGTGTSGSAHPAGNHPADALRPAGTLHGPAVATRTFSDGEPAAWAYGGQPAAHVAYRGPAPRAGGREPADQTDDREAIGQADGRGPTGQADGRGPTGQADGRESTAPTQGREPAVAVIRAAATTSTTDRVSCNAASAGRRHPARRPHRPAGDHSCTPLGRSHDPGTADRAAARRGGRPSPSGSQPDRYERIRRRTRCRGDRAGRAVADQQ